MGCEMRVNCGMVPTAAGRCAITARPAAHDRPDHRPARRGLFPLKPCRGGGRLRWWTVWPHPGKPCRGGGRLRWWTVWPHPGKPCRGGGRLRWWIVCPPCGMVAARRISLVVGDMPRRCHQSGVSPQATSWDGTLLNREC